MSTHLEISGNYQLETRRTYEENFEYFKEKFNANARELNYLSTFVDLFLSRIPKNRLIGSGERKNLIKKFMKS